MNSGQSFMEPYLAYDQDGDNISVFELKVTYRYISGTSFGHHATNICM